MMDAQGLVLSLLQKIFSKKGKLHTYRLKYLDLKRYAGCSSFNGNVGEHYFKIEFVELYQSNGSNFVFYALQFLYMR